MNVELAAKYLKKEYPDRKPIGYWEDGESIVFQTKPHYYGRGWTEIIHYIVSPDGTVIGTNPLRTFVIEPHTMKKI